MKFKKNPSMNCEIFNEQVIGLILNLNEFFFNPKGREFY